MLKGFWGSAWSKIRRAYLIHLRRRHVVETIAGRRVGQCRRCGKCCHIAHRCPFLNGTNDCSIYERRPLQCRMFPINEKDLMVVPGCGFDFTPPPERQGAAEKRPLRGRVVALVARLVAFVLAS